MERLQNKHSFGFLAVSLGYFDTLMSISSASTSSELSEKEKADSGISSGYIRMSVGITGESAVARLSRNRAKGCAVVTEGLPWVQKHVRIFNVWAMCSSGRGRGFEVRLAWC